MKLFEDDEDEESIPRKAFEEGWDGPNPKEDAVDETEEAFEKYLNGENNTDDEITYNDLTIEEQRIVDETFEEEEN